MAETDGSNVIRAVYANEPGEFGGLISQRRSAGATWLTSYYHFDAVGSTRGLTSLAQNFVAFYPATAFGEQLTDSAQVNPFRFVGQLGYYYDREAGQNQVRERPYSPKLGRWLIADPARSDANLYRYVGNSPMRGVDPAGLEEVPYAFNRDFSGYLNRYILIIREAEMEAEVNGAMTSRMKGLLPFVGPDLQAIWRAKYPEKTFVFPEEFQSNPFFQSEWIDLSEYAPRQERLKGFPTMKAAPPSNLSEGRRNLLTRLYRFQELARRKITALTLEPSLESELRNLAKEHGIDSLDDFASPLNPSFGLYFSVAAHGIESGDALKTDSPSGYYSLVWRHVRRHNAIEDLEKATEVLEGVAKALNAPRQTAQTMEAYDPHIQSGRFITAWEQIQMDLKYSIQLQNIRNNNRRVRSMQPRK